MYRDSIETRKQIINTGRATWDLGLNSLKSGNISVLLPKRSILITRTGRSLRNLKPHKDLTTVPRSQTARGDASCEFDVHRAIYEMTGCTGGAICTAIRRAASRSARCCAASSRPHITKRATCSDQPPS